MKNVSPSYIGMFLEEFEVFIANLKGLGQSFCCQLNFLCESPRQTPSDSLLRLTLLTLENKVSLPFYQVPGFPKYFHSLVVNIREDFNFPFKLV